MRLIVSLVLLLALLVPAAHAQCTQVTIWYTNYTQRQTGNAVISYAETEVSGADALYWTLTQDTWYYVHNALAYYNELISSQGGGGVWQEYWATLQGVGPGEFTLNSLHKGNNTYCGTSAPPYSDGWNGHAESDLTVARPTISRTNVPMFLGGATASGTQSAMTMLSANPNGAPASSTIQWAFLDGSDKGQLQPVPGSPSYQYYTATAPASSCGFYNEQIIVSYDGFHSDTFWISNNALSYVLQEWGGPWSSVVVPGNPPGWQTPYTYKVVDMCGGGVNWVEVNETFGDSSDFLGANWCLPGPVPDTCGWAWGTWAQPYLFNGSGDFVDYLSEQNVPGKFPLVLPAWQNGLDESAASLVMNTWQTFYGGSPTNGSGINLGSYTMDHYLDHGKSVQ